MNKFNCYSRKIRNMNRLPTMSDRTARKISAARFQNKKHKGKRVPSSLTVRDLVVGRIIEEILKEESG